MTFNDIAQSFAQSESGTDSFKRFYRACFDLMKQDIENAALYFVVAVAARSYVMRYEDQAISAATAENAKKAIDGFNAKLVAALSQPPAERLKVLGQVATDYEWNVEGF